MKARHCFLTLIGQVPTLNIVLDSDEETEVLVIEITESHLCNLVQDGVRIAFRPEVRK